jgi:hypothetical protein
MTDALWQFDLVWALAAPKLRPDRNIGGNHDLWAVSAVD